MSRTLDPAIDGSPVWTPNGTHIAFSSRRDGGVQNIYWVRADGAREVQRLTESKNTQTPYSFSPDGRWLAYHSDESGTMEIYVRPFPGPGGEWKISNGGGVLAKWSPNGRELYYRTMDSRSMVANYTVEGDTFVAGKPQLWSDAQFVTTGVYRNSDLAPDGKRFAVLMAADETGEAEAPAHVTFLLNFFDELKRRVPVE